MRRRKGWIRRIDGSTDNRAKIQAQALRGAVWVAWWATPDDHPKGHRVCVTRTEGEHLQEVWKRWHERLGFKVWSFGGVLWAHPFERPGQFELRSGFGIHKYNPDTLERQR